MAEPQRSQTSLEDFFLPDFCSGPVVLVVIVELVAFLLVLVGLVTKTAGNCRKTEATRVMFHFQPPWISKRRYNEEKTMRNVLISILLMLVSGTAFSRDTQAVRMIIDRANADASRWYASGDIDAVTKLFAKDAWQMPPNSPPLVGREAIAKYWKQAVQWGHWQFTLHAQDVEVSGPMAVERGKYVLKFTAGPVAPAGMPSFEDRGNYLVYWRREKDGQWRVVVDAPVSELPLPTPPPPRSSGLR